MEDKSQNKISTLRCEPYFADNSECEKDYYGLMYPFECLLWRVFADEVCIADEVIPFLATDDVVELSAHKCVPVFGDGSDYTIVRVLGDKVLWFGSHDMFISTYDDSPLPSNSVYMFKAAQYADAVKQAQAAESSLRKPVEVNTLQKFINRLRGVKSDQPFRVIGAPKEVKPIPHLKPAELQDILRGLYPRDLDLPLYRMPEHPDDFRGSSLFRVVWDVINMKGITISEPPPNPIEIEIGLDADVFVQSKWQAGKVGEDIAILFIAEPHFPLWLGGFKSIEKWIVELQ